MKVSQNQPVRRPVLFRTQPYNNPQLTKLSS